MTKSSDSKIKVLRLGHVYYKHKDSAKAEKFLAAFGFIEVKREGKRIYYRGYGSEPFLYCLEESSTNEFGGAALVVESPEDLEKAGAIFPDATEIYDLEEAPGGGRCVTVKDPIDGWPLHLVYGQTPVEPMKDYRYLDFNFVGRFLPFDSTEADPLLLKPHKKNRAGNEFQRFEKGPALIHKLGHFGLCVTQFQKTFDFYTTNFNFVPSDIQHDETGRHIASFIHLDLGETFTDHHSFFIFEGPKSHVHHSSFEVHDFDVEVLGHDYLRDQGYQNCWGVGRHVLGSQIFDYWYDPSGFIVEHYVDGDQVNCHSKTNIELATPDGLHVWGPRLPEGFLT
ncbi:VOC domain-containing protein [Fusarium sp. Ph1]|nr:VOC domain-containing protein [Fusarium sp. Ph1]